MGIDEAPRRWPLPSGWEMHVKLASAALGRGLIDLKTFVRAMVAIDPTSTADTVRAFWSDRTSQEDEMRNWVTGFERIPLEVGEPLEPNVEYYVQVRLRTTPRRASVFWPFTHDDAAGRKEFTFIR